MTRNLISAEELKMLLDNEAAYVVDCRFFLQEPDKGHSDYLNGHIPGAAYLHLDRDLSGPIEPGVTGRHPLPEPDVLIKRLGQWGIHRESHVVVYDQAPGAIAARLWWMMRWLGHSKVHVLDGGWKNWQSAGLPTEAGAVMHTPVAYEVKAGADSSMTLEADQVRQWSGLGEKCIIDARLSERYAGIVEPIDPVAGHIPNAHNWPFLDNLNDSGMHKSADHLRSIYEEVEQYGIKNTVVYCGSGVTACHVILALDEAGLGLSKLYPGSWSEWITDPDRPVAKSHD